MRLLIVEDDPAIGDLLTDFLADAGYKTDRAADGFAALTAFHQNDGSIGLVLLDVLLPGLDGFSVCRRIRETSDVPIIMISALDAEQDQMMGFDLLVDDYITKPFSLVLVLRRIEAVLRRATGTDGSSFHFGSLFLDP